MHDLNSGLPKDNCPLCHEVVINMEFDKEKKTFSLLCKNCHSLTIDSGFLNSSYYEIILMNNIYRSILLDDIKNNNTSSYYLDGNKFNALFHASLSGFQKLTHLSDSRKN